jgi:hypothetical protein
MVSVVAANWTQERELEKVNAFYLQKEAEVRTMPHLLSFALGPALTPASSKSA